VGKPGDRFEAQCAVQEGTARHCGIYMCCFAPFGEGVWTGDRFERMRCTRKTAMRICMLTALHPAWRRSGLVTIARRMRCDTGASPLPWNLHVLLRRAEEAS
jgi:hypothetical protein